MVINEPRTRDGFILSKRIRLRLLREDRQAATTSGCGRLWLSVQLRT